MGEARLEVHHRRSHQEPAPSEDSDLPNSNYGSSINYFKWAEAPAPAPSPIEANTLQLAVPLDPLCQVQPYARYVQVADTLGLQIAMNASQPGDLIELLPGTYDRSLGFNLTMYSKNGLPDLPITVCGPRTATIVGWGNASRRPYGFYVFNSTFIINLLGFSVQDNFKGVVLDYSNNCLVYRLRILRTGFEAVRIRSYSNNNVVQECEIADTGFEDPGLGEGVYIGTSFQCGYDPSNGNQVVSNVFGLGVTAEMVDAKENTCCGLIASNVFEGASLSMDGYADSWVDVKGQSYLVQNNVGNNSPRDGFQTHDRGFPGSGESNVFQGNTCNLSPGTGGLCVAVTCDGGPDACGNQVYCNNLVSNGGLTNMAGCIP